MTAWIEGACPGCGASQIRPEDLAEADWRCPQCAASPVIEVSEDVGARVALLVIVGALAIIALALLAGPCGTAG